MNRKPLPSKTIPDEQLSQNCTVTDLLQPQQFNQLSSQIGLEISRRQQLLNSIYNPFMNYHHHDRNNAKQQDPKSQYMKQYQKWKKQKDMKKHNTQYQYEVEDFEKLKDRHMTGFAIYRYDQSCRELERLRDEYRGKMDNILEREREVAVIEPIQRVSRISQKTNLNYQVELQEERVNRQAIEREVQKELLRRINNINQQQEKQQKIRQKQEEFSKSCYSNLITNPPQQKVMSISSRLNKHNKHSEQFQEEPPIQKPKQSSLKKKKELKFKLKMNDLLQMPPKIFLVFFEENKTTISRLATAQEMKELQRHRNKAVVSEEAITKLKQAVSKNGDKIVQKLSPQKRQKLFDVLYGKDVELSKYYEQKQQS